MSTYQTYIVECPNCKVQNDLTICPTWNEYISGSYNPPKNMCKNCGKELKFTECKILRNKYPIKRYDLKIKNIEELVNQYLSSQIKSIYAYMYCSSHQGDGNIIQISKKELSFHNSENSRKYSPYLIYVWGGPGPDYNTYYFQDYGKTWAFSKEELVSNMKFIIQNFKSEQPKKIEDSWEEIIKNKNTSKYKIGDFKNLKIGEKEIPFEIIGINNNKLFWKEILNE